MGFNDHIDHDLSHRIDQLIDGGYLVPGTTEHGVARQASEAGLGSLSAKQRFVWDRGIYPLFVHVMTDQERWDVIMDQDREAEHLDGLKDRPPKN